MDNKKINELLQSGDTNSVVNFFQSEQFNNIKEIINNLSSIMGEAINTGNIALVKTLMPLMTTSANANNLIIHPDEESYSNNEHLLKMRSLDMCFQKALSSQQYEVASVLIDEMIPHLVPSYTMYNGSLQSLMQTVSSYGNIEVFDKMESAVFKIQKPTKEEYENFLNYALSNNNTEIVEHMITSRKVSIEDAMKNYAYHSEEIQQLLLKPEFGVLENRKIDKGFLLDEAIEKYDLDLVKNLMNNKEIVPHIKPSDAVFYILQSTVNQRLSESDNEKILELVDYMLTSEMFTPPQDIHELLLFGAAYNDNVELVKYLLTSPKLNVHPEMNNKGSFLNAVTCHPVYEVADYVFNNPLLVSKISKKDMETCFINVISYIYHGGQNAYESNTQNIDRAKTVYELALKAKIINKIEPSVASIAIQHADHYMIDFLMSIDHFKPYILEHGKYMLCHALIAKKPDALQYFMDIPEFNSIHGWKNAMSTYNYNLVANQHYENNSDTQNILDTLHVLVQNKPELTSKIKQYFIDNSNPDIAQMVVSHLDDVGSVEKKKKP